MALQTHSEQWAVFSCSMFDIFLDLICGTISCEIVLNKFLEELLDCQIRLCTSEFLFIF